MPNWRRTDPAKIAQAAKEYACREAGVCLYCEGVGQIATHDGVNAGWRPCPQCLGLPLRRRPMSERPTPRQIMVKCDLLRSVSPHDGWPGEVVDDMLGELRAKGYRIVHEPTP